MPETETPQTPDEVEREIADELTQTSGELAHYGGYMTHEQQVASQQSINKQHDQICQLREI